MLEREEWLEATVLQKVPTSSQRPRPICQPTVPTVQSVTNREGFQPNEEKPTFHSNLRNLNTPHLEKKSHHPERLFIENCQFFDLAQTI